MGKIQGLPPEKWSKGGWLRLELFTWKILGQDLVDFLRLLFSTQVFCFQKAPWLRFRAANHDSAVGRSGLSFHALPFCVFSGYIKKPFFVHTTSAPQQLVRQELLQKISEGSLDPSTTNKHGDPDSMVSPSRRFRGFSKRPTKAAMHCDKDGEEKMGHI